MSRFQYVSYVTDDLDAAVGALETIQMPCAWRGRHPYFGVEAAVCASRKGGVMAMQAGDGDDVHPAVRHYVGARERMFHIALSDPPAGWEGAPVVRTASEPYEGPCGTARAVEVELTDGTGFWLEVSSGGTDVGDPRSGIARIESTPVISETLGVFEEPFMALGFDWVRHLASTRFPTLGSDSHIFLLDDWHYFELNEPYEESVMSRLLAEIGQPGLFGLSAEPVDMDAFVDHLHERGVRANTKDPIRLPVTVDGRELGIDVITLPPTSTGGARMFMIGRGEYPWPLL